MIRTVNIENDYVNNKDLINLPFEFYNSDKYKSFKFKCFDTVIVMVGASIGKIGLITSKNIPSLQNQNMWRFRPINSDISPIFIHFYVKHINKRVKNWSTGSAREFYKKDFFKKFKCVIPPKEVLNEFNDLSSIYFQQINNNLLEIEKLVRIRDSYASKID